MVSERWMLVRGLFARAAELEPDQREAFLRGETDDEGLIREVNDLLAADEEASGFMEGGAIPVADLPQDPVGHWVGRRFGPYEATREIGRGGMGVVLLGERADGRYQGHVAIKVIHAALMHGDLVERFRSEGQILADLDHPNVARLLDAGDTDDGLSYLIMEYVDGPRIDVYADDNLLDVSGRLALFRAVLDGADYAHARGVVHRDLKPSNILVTSQGQPKLVDFGIAKLLSASTDATAELTRTATRMMTPEYASPEQVLGRPVDASSDVYSLGVVLYRLLTGRAPYRLSATEPRDSERIICEEPPRRPSTAITLPIHTEPGTTEVLPNADVLARNRSSTLDRLQRTLRGDLDTIVLQALAKEPPNRYPTAGAFADDIDRHLDGRPIRASQPGLVYRSTKFVRRRRVPMTIAMLVLTGLGLAVWQAGVASTQRGVAEANSARLAELVQSITSSVNLGQREEAGATATRETQVTAALEALEDVVAQAGDEPTAELLYQLAGAYREMGMLQGHVYSSNLGKIDEGTASLERAMELAGQVVQMKPDGLDGRNALGQIQSLVADQYVSTGRGEEGMAMYDQSASTLEAVRADFPDDARVLDGLGALYSRLGILTSAQGASAQSLEYYQKGLEVDERYAEITPNNDRRTAVQDVAAARGNMAQILALLGRMDEALEMDQAAMKTADSLVNAEPSQRSQMLQGFLHRGHAVRLFLIDRAADGERFGGRAAEILGEVLAEDPGNVSAANELILSLMLHAQLLINVDQPAQALDQAVRALDVMSPLAESQPDIYLSAIAEAERTRGYALADLQRWAEADDAFATARSSYEQLVESGTGFGGVSAALKGLATTQLAIAKRHYEAAGPSGTPTECARAQNAADAGRAAWDDASGQGSVGEGEQALWDRELRRVPFDNCA